MFITVLKLLFFRYHIIHTFQNGRAEKTEPSTFCEIVDYWMTIEHSCWVWLLKFNYALLVIMSWLQANLVNTRSSISLHILCCENRTNSNYGSCSDDLSASRRALLIVRKSFVVLYVVNKIWKVLKTWGNDSMWNV